MSLPAVPLVPTANNPQSVGHPDTVCTRITATNGLLPGQFPAVSVVQTDLTTPGSTAALELGGGGGAGGPVGASNYILYKTCGPAAGGLVPDHLQLFRYGPTGAVNPTVAQVLDIAPKMVADSSPAQNIATLFADLTVGGDVTAPVGFKSVVLNFPAATPGVLSPLFTATTPGIWIVNGTSPSGGGSGYVSQTICNVWRSPGTNLLSGGIVALGSETAMGIYMNGNASQTATPSSSVAVAMGIDGTTPINLNVSITALSLSP